MISTLIDGPDGFERVRDKIAAILLLESVNQVALATTAGKPDPQQWALEIFLEASNPFEKWLNFDVDSPPNSVPVVNVWYDSDNADPSGSNVVQRQKTTGVFNIDCYGFGISAETVEGHTPGDKAAALEAHRALRLVRNIVMASEYTYLDLRGLVWQRWPRSRTVFQPQFDGRTVQNIVGSRLALEVVYNELSPQYVGDVLEQINVSVYRKENGALYFEAEY